MPDLPETRCRIASRRGSRSLAAASRGRCIRTPVEAPPDGSPPSRPARAGSGPKARVQHCVELWAEEPPRAGAVPDNGEVITSYGRPLAVLELRPGQFHRHAATPSLGLL